jgi:hypothetical protein
MPAQVDVLADLTNALAFAGGIVSTAHIADPSGQFVYPPDTRSFLTEAAVVRVFVAWERFLEQSFLSYVMGFPSVRGTAVTSYLQVPTITHASRVLTGTQKYVDWGNPDIVSRLAELYFPGGSPFKNVVAALQSDLFDLRTIRNAAAHLSTTTSTQLDGVALRRLGKAAIGVSVYDLVTATNPGTPGQTILQMFLDVLQSGASIIANI